MSMAIQKGCLPGCVKRITELHADYYRKHAGFGVAFEAKVARELTAFCERYDDQRDGLWLAIDAGTIQGALAIDGLLAENEGAHLRWFIAADEVRGSGLGTRLLEAAMEFCRLRGYVRVYLWTFDGLAAARHLYEKFDFQLVHQQRGSQWGAEVTEQRFEKTVVPSSRQLP
jgi:GNAT superfamily N-acetyltransferase